MNTAQNLSQIQNVACMVYQQDHEPFTIKEWRPDWQVITHISSSFFYILFVSWGLKKKTLVLESKREGGVAAIVGGEISTWTRRAGPAMACYIKIRLHDACLRTCSMDSASLDPAICNTATPLSECISTCGTHKW